MIVILLIINLITTTLLLHSKKEESKASYVKTELSKEANTLVNKISSSYFMTNTIDQYFSNKMCQENISQIELRDLQNKYYFVWKNEYARVMDLIKKKCIYEQDIENYNIYIESIDSQFQSVKPLLLNEILDNYSLVESPEKHSMGNGTLDVLKMYEGMNYRNACIIFIPYLVGEYEFPSTAQIEQNY